MNEKDTQNQPATQTYTTATYCQYGNAVVCYMAQIQEQPFIPWVPWVPVPAPAPCPPSQITINWPPSPLEQKVDELTKEVERLRHTQEGMKQAIDRFMAKGKRK